MRAYERLPAESPQAFEAYKVYRDMGPGRSRKLVGERLGKDVSLMSRWQGRHSWVERARERDEYIDSIKQQAIDEYAREQAVTMAAREQEIQTTLLDARLASAKKLTQMLQFPLVETQTEDEGRTIIVKPARWTFNTIRTLGYFAGGRGEDVQEVLDMLERRLSTTTGTVDVSSLSPSEQAQLDELLDRINTGSGPASH
jgi:hypothetical protein